MDLSAYRQSDQEKQRTGDLMRIVQNLHNADGNALDVGARDGHFSKLLSEHFDNVVALDLEKPPIQHKGVSCLQGDITNLDFCDNYFDLVFCAEVLEHVPTSLLEKACLELSRVSNEFLLIGVPYKQDIRVGRTTCHSCGKKNPPWGHVNRFDKNRLEDLFPRFNVSEVSFAGKTNSFTNSISTMLMDLGGNVYGTYSQEEPCIACGEKLKIPPERTLLQKIFTRASFCLSNTQKIFTKEQSNWIHVLFQKN